MRIWSLHPKYLDSKGLVALWRETLLAKNVLTGKTKGYSNHPQLDRFKATARPMDAINYYLEMVWKEAVKRNYKFDKSKFEVIKEVELIPVTTGQLKFEMAHLLKKLNLRDKLKYAEIIELQQNETHSLFKLIEGEIELWEKL